MINTRMAKPTKGQTMNTRVFVIKQKIGAVPINIFSLIKRVFKVNIIYCLDLILFGLVIFYLVYNLLAVILSIIDICGESYWKDLVHNMCEGDNVQNSITHTTNVSIIHDDSGWSNAIRQIFIYGTGALRLHLIRGGTPGTRGFIIGSTLMADGLSRVINNTINDPEYVRNHIENWRKVWKDGEVLDVTVDESTSKKILEVMDPHPVDNVQNFISSDDLGKFSETIVNSIMGRLKDILEPAYVNYSNDILLEQIYGLSILLFILSLLIIILFVGFILNILIFVYSDRILNYFTNKYIRAYIQLNKKLIGIEIFFLSGSILYFLYVLSHGLHFICTHPISLS